MALAALQVSLTVTEPRTFGTAAWQLASALTAGMAEQAITGLVVSLTVKVVVHESLFPAASVAVTVMVWTPRPTSAPADGVCVRVIALAALQVSLTVTAARTFGTAAWQVPSALTAGMAGQVITGLVGFLTLQGAGQ